MIEVIVNCIQVLLLIVLLLFIGICVINGTSGSRRVRIFDKPTSKRPAKPQGQGNVIPGIPNKLPAPVSQVHIRHKEHSNLLRSKGIVEDVDMDPRPDICPGAQGRPSNYEKDPCIDCIHNKKKKDDGMIV